MWSGIKKITWNSKPFYGFFLGIITSYGSLVPSAGTKNKYKYKE
jgi:hypothetical protein